jgi:hypothetical protein
MGRPALPPSEKRKPRSLMLNDAEAAEVEELKELLGVSRNDAIMLAVRRLRESLSEEPAAH